MEKIEVVVIGAGPAGLSAAAEAARLGARVLVIDENEKPGGQLFKQIHKFFGSREHLAGVRGYDIGYRLLAETTRLAAEIRLNTVVYGLYSDKKIAIINNTGSQLLQAEKIILATGASENALAFPGSTLPGIMSAGAVQTMINLHRVLPDPRVLMVGSGNVGLIVSYQILQAGGRVAALIEAAPRIGGYSVHAAKIRRAGVPIYTGYTVKQAYGADRLEGAVIIALDEQGRPVAGSEKDLAVGCMAIAVGLTPLAELAQLCGCEFTYVPRLGGLVPVHDANMETTVPGIYAAGDITGVEEASSAMEEGRLAGIAAAEALGHVPAGRAALLKAKVWTRLNLLRTGRMGQYRREAKDAIIALGNSSQQETAAARQRFYACTGGEKTSTEIAAKDGNLAERELARVLPGAERMARGPVAVIECLQDIPCNPCESACPVRAITVGDPITSLPVLNTDACVGCGRCIAQCPGLAIFVVDGSGPGNTGKVHMPYEYYPLPEKGDVVECLDRKGQPVAAGKIVRVHNARDFDHTAVVTVEVPKREINNVRGIRPMGRGLCE